jgi:Domain of unknown function (DUF6046)
MNKEWNGTVTLKTPLTGEDGKPILPRLTVVLNTVLCTVKGGHNVDTQHLNQAYNGTIKTHVNEKDFEVTLKGMLVSPNYEQSYPHEQMKELEEILKHGGALEVISDFLLIFGIYNLFVTGYSMGQMEGTENVQPYEISCLSDAPIEILAEL